jgi:tetratricopeptide (TPR) repeat protein
MAAASDDPAARLLAARAAMVIGDFPLAEDLLVASWRNKVLNSKAPEGQVSWETALIELYSAWSQEVKPEQGRTELELLERAWEIAPGAPWIYRRFQSIAMGGDPVEAEKAMDLLHVGLARGADPLLLHTILGMIASHRGEHAQALLHFQMAHEYVPQHGPAMSNLASSMILQETPDLDAALALIDQAIALGPDLPEMHDTRGHILARMNRWSEALRELAPVALALPNNIQLHTTLADLYERADLPALAREHQAKAKKLAAEKSP